MKDIIFLSKPEDYTIDDGGYNLHVTDDNFWVTWRFNVLKRNIPKDMIKGKILEVGCGKGIALEFLKNNYDCQVSGCDLNLKALESSVSSASIYFYDINSRKKEWEGSFSSIFLLDVLEHISNTALFLESVNFHLKENGIVVINVPAQKILFSKYDSAQGHIKRYNLKLLNSELTKANFEIISVNHWGILLLPVLLLRKFVMLFCNKNNAVKIGLNSNFRLASLILNLLKDCENKIMPYPFTGISLFIIARKR